MKDLPNEGIGKPCPSPMNLWELEVGDTVNFHEPCTLTLLAKVEMQEGIRLLWEVSDVKYSDPDSPSISASGEGDEPNNL